MFPKYINVFDCIHIYAESSVSDLKVLHAAAIAAELLDNDEDGIIDDENVQNALMEVYTVMPLFAYEGSNAEEILFDNFDDLMDNNNFCAGAVLYNNEIDPSSPGFWGNDASVEEIFFAIIPDLPIPDKIIFPFLQFNIFSTAFLKLKSNEFFNLFKDTISVFITSFAIFL